MSKINKLAGLRKILAVAQSKLAGVKTAKQWPKKARDAITSQYKNFVSHIQQRITKTKMKPETVDKGLSFGGGVSVTYFKEGKMKIHQIPMDSQNTKILKSIPEIANINFGEKVLNLHRGESKSHSNLKENFSNLQQKLVLDKKNGKVLPSHIIGFSNLAFILERSGISVYNDLPNSTVKQTGQYQRLFGQQSPNFPLTDAERKQKERIGVDNKGKHPIKLAMITIEDFMNIDFTGKSNKNKIVKSKPDEIKGETISDNYAERKKAFSEKLSDAKQGHNSLVTFPVVEQINNADCTCAHYFNVHRHLKIVSQYKNITDLREGINHPLDKQKITTNQHVDNYGDSLEVRKLYEDSSLNTLTVSALTTTWSKQLKLKKIEEAVNTVDTFAITVFAKQHAISYFSIPGDPTNVAYIDSLSSGASIKITKEQMLKNLHNSGAFTFTLALNWGTPFNIQDDSTPAQSVSR